MLLNDLLILFYHFQVGCGFLRLDLLRTIVVASGWGAAAPPRGRVFVPMRVETGWDEFK
jgi:hypothetical protein